MLVAVYMYSTTYQLWYHTAYWIGNKLNTGKVVRVHQLTLSHPMHVVADILIVI